MKKYFYLEESPYMKTYQAIYLNHGNFPFEGKIYGSSRSAANQRLYSSLYNFTTPAIDFLIFLFAFTRTDFTIP